jgi:NAD(P)-dependent dehydrogenase (short-subunit alcohol dehydrogenase family)
MMDLSGKTVVVTGGGGHLGRAMALGLADAGANVLICGRTRAKLDSVAKASNGRVKVQVADLSKDEGIAAVLDAAEGISGKIHGWVNNAYSGATGRLLELTRSDVEASIAGGLTTPMLALDSVARRMVRAGVQGSIVNVATMYALVSPRPAVYANYPQFHNPPAYGAAKAGLVQLTRYAACHLAQHGIRVNCVSPGPFPSGVAAAEKGFADELIAQVPLRRLGRPEDVVGGVLFLLSDAAAYVTGHNLVIDGGWTAW